MSYTSNLLSAITKLHTCYYYKATIICAWIFQKHACHALAWCTLPPTINLQLVPGRCWKASH